MNEFPPAVCFVRRKSLRKPMALRMSSYPTDHCRLGKFHKLPGPCQECPRQEKQSWLSPLPSDVGPAPSPSFVTRHTFSLRDWSVLLCNLPGLLWKKEVTCWLFSLLSWGCVTILVFLFGLRNDFFSLCKSFKKHVLFIFCFDVSELVCPGGEASRGVCVCVVFVHSNYLLPVCVCVGGRYLFTVIVFLQQAWSHKCCKNVVCILGHSFGGNFKFFLWVLTEPYFLQSLPFGTSDR